MAGKLNGNPWVDIWLEPRSTIRAIVNYNPKYQFVLLSAIYGLPMVLNFAQSLSSAATLPLWAILIASLAICPFIGALGITVCAALLTWTGKWIGGKSGYDRVRAAVAWSNVPNAVTVALWAVLIGVFGSQVFLKAFSESTFMGFQAGVVFIVFLLEAVVSVWGFILLLKTLGEVQGFSAWKALLNVVISLVIVIAAIWVLGWIIWGTVAVVN